MFITKTRLYNFDPLKPHFYIVKLGFTGVYIIFLIFAQNIDCWYSLEPPRRGGSNEYPQSMFWAEIWKLSDFFLSENFQFLKVKFSIYLNRRVFVMPVFTTYKYILLKSIIESHHLLPAIAYAMPFIVTRNSNMSSIVFRDTILLNDIFGLFFSASRNALFSVTLWSRFLQKYTFWILSCRWLFFCVRSQLFFIIHYSKRHFPVRQQLDPGLRSNCYCFGVGTVEFIGKVSVFSCVLSC